MTNQQFKKITTTLNKAYKELEEDAFLNGTNTASPEYQDALNEVKILILKSMGFSLEEFNQTKAKLSNFSQEELMDEVGVVKEALSKLVIPSQKEIESIAESVAQKYIKPPQITNQIVKETIVEKPITKVVIQKEEYDPNPLYAEIGYINDKIENLPTPDPNLAQNMRSEFEQQLKDAINTLDMPDFRKMGMGLQTQIEEVRAIAGNGVSAGDKGDITVAANGTWSIDSGVVTDTKIDPTADVMISTITFIIDGGGSAITTGIKGDLEIPFNCTINRATLLADQSGSIVVDIWKDTYANYPPTVADTITASAKPTLSSASKSQDSTLTGWTTAITAGSTLRFNVDSATTVTRVTLSLKVTKT